MERLKTSSRIWLLSLYTAASFWGQMTAFTPIFLWQLGLPVPQIPTTVGLIAAIVGAAGIPFLPFWGALADHYARKPLVLRSFVVYLFAGMVAVLAGNLWVFVLGRSLMSLSLGNTGLMLTTLSERTPSNRLGLAFAVMNSAGRLAPRWGRSWADRSSTIGASGLRSPSTSRSSASWRLPWRSGIETVTDLPPARPSCAWRPNQCA